MSYPQQQGTPAPPPPTKHEESLPLPKWLGRLYYIFPIVLYLPDVIFNFYVYSDGSGINLSRFDITQLPLIVLWGFLSAGIVGMAWLLSILAPWHWVRRNRFQSLMCWCGVFIATGITTWNSLAYRSQKFQAFATDQMFAHLFGINLQGFSPTMVLVSVSPPFWGLFWAIVQPSERKRSKQQEEEDFQLKLERLRQEAEIKKLKAEANAQIREAQLKGLASTVKAARAQIGSGGKTDTTVTEERIVDSSISDAQGQLSEATPPAQIPEHATPEQEAQPTISDVLPSTETTDITDPAPPDRAPVVSFRRPKTREVIRRGLPEHVNRPAVDE